MEALAYSLLLLVSARYLSAATSYCEKERHCFCTSSNLETEIQCPSTNDLNVVLKITPATKVVNLQCLRQFRWEDQLLTNLEIGDVEYLTFQQCPLPSNFFDFMQRLGINNTRELKFTLSNDLRSATLTADYFLGLSGLQKLDLSGNDLRNIDANAFEPLEELKILDLGFNKLHLTNETFKHLHNLTSLYLNSNELSELPLDVFQNLDNLEKLHLWANELTSIDNKVIQNLKNLKLLELSRNRFRRLRNDMFSHLINLKELSLFGNELNIIEKDVFTHNVLLNFVNLNRNNLIDLPDYLFSNLSELAKVSLNECQLKSLPQNLFWGSASLQELFVQNNALETVSSLFNNTPSLQQLDMSYNRITTLPNNIFTSLTQLKVLNLENNLMTSINQHLLKNLKNLESLNLSHNNVEQIDLDAFVGAYDLKTIDLSYNRFDLPRKDVGLGYKTAFNDNTRLKTVNLAHNKITMIDECFLLTMVTLEELDLSYNDIEYIDFRSIWTVSPSVNIDLQSNKITTIDFRMAELIAQQNFDSVDSSLRRVNVNGNPVICNCHMYDLVRYFQRTIDPTVPSLMTIEASTLTCAAPADFVKYPVKRLKQNMLTCTLDEYGLSGNFTDGCLYGFKTWDNSLIINCVNANFTEPPILSLPTENFYNQTVIYLQNNSLLQSPGPNMGYENVTLLNLSFNKINQVTWLPPQLQVLSLDGNNISFLSHETLRLLNSTNLRTLSLGDNPWNCDCQSVDLIDFISYTVRIKEIDANDIKCNKVGKQLVVLKPEMLCPNYMPFILGFGISISLLALLIAVAVAFYYRFQQEVKVWLFAHDMCLWFVTEDEIDRDKLYDAFISYSHKDEEFVLTEILPVLENGPKPYKLCVHVRDWIAGEFISKQIATSVTESRRTIVILSKNFLESEWGKMEFRTAHKQAIHEGRARVILILYDDINMESDLDEELKAYVRTNTYVKWGDPWFWDKLRYALPHPQKSSKDSSQKTQNIMVAINERLGKLDDKLDLINGNSTPNPGSTPPADPLLLKCSPLNFRKDTLTPPAEAGLNPLKITIEH